MKTRGDLLQFAIFFALSKVRVARFKLGMNAEQREEAARDTIYNLRKTGQWRDLDDPLPDWVETMPEPYEPKRDA